VTGRTAVARWGTGYTPLHATCSAVNAYTSDSGTASSATNTSTDSFGSRNDCVRYRVSQRVCTVYVRLNYEMRQLAPSNARSEPHPHAFHRLIWEPQSPRHPQPTCTTCTRLTAVIDLRACIERRIPQRARKGQGKDAAAVKNWLTGIAAYVANRTPRTSAPPRLAASGSRITVWTHAAATKRARDDADDEGHDLAAPDLTCFFQENI